LTLTILLYDLSQTVMPSTD